MKDSSNNGPTEPSAEADPSPLSLMRYSISIIERKDGRLVCQSYWSTIGAPKEPTTPDAASKRTSGC
jgi:hypothetical protein